MVFVICVILAAVLFYACCVQSGKDARKEEEHPCDSCLRWDECNGVDEYCPNRSNKNNDGGKNE